MNAYHICKVDNDALLKKNQQAISVMSVAAITSNLSLVPKNWLISSKILFSIRSVSLQRRLLVFRC